MKKAASGEDAAFLLTGSREAYSTTSTTRRVVGSTITG